MRLARETGLGAQFGGVWLAHEARFVRLPRHAGSCPVGIGVSCNADRGLRGKITADGVFLEEVERRPARFLEGAAAGGPGRGRRRRSRPADAERSWRSCGRFPSAPWSGCPGRSSSPGTSPTPGWPGSSGRPGDVPDYLKRHPVYYAGPAKTPRGHGLGQFRPDDGPAHGRLHGRFPQGRGLARLARQGQPDGARRSRR